MVKRMYNILNIGNPNARSPVADRQARETTGATKQ